MGHCDDTFFEELANEESGIIYLVGDFSESKDKCDKVTYEICNELYVMCSCALFETEGILCKYILCILWHNHVTYF